MLLHLYDFDEDDDDCLNYESIKDVPTLSTLQLQ